MNKNFLRITALVISLILLCSIFTGCKELDEMKGAQGYINEDGSIEFNGNKYLLITGLAIPDTSAFDPFMILDKEVYITKPDVPVLLSTSIFEKSGYISTDKVIICLYEGDYDETYYCREDKHEEMIERLKETFVPEVLAYYYDSYDYDRSEYSWGTYTLTDEQKKAVNSVLSSISPQQIENYYVYDDTFCCDIYECSEDLTFSRYVLSIEYINGQYAVTKEIGYGITEKYAVPNELYPIFSEIMEEYFIATEIYTELDAGAV